MFNAPAIGGRKERSLDAVKREDLLRDRFVLGHENGMWPRARVAQSQQVYICDHVHFLGVVAAERLGQIEDQVGIAPRKRVQGLGRPSNSKYEGSCPSFCSASKISSRSVFSFLTFFTFLRGLG